MSEENTYKGIVLAGGAGTRLYPLTKMISKQLLPIYNKPMIYYPLYNLIDAGIKDILIITAPSDQKFFVELLGDGSQWGVSIEYAIQVRPEGIAQSLIIAEEWLDGASSVLILGDNLFFGPNLSIKLKDAMLSNDGATVFSYQVQDPERYGVLELDDELNIINIEEKPSKPKSNWIVTGLYIYDEEASKISQGLKKSERGELEITDLNRVYLNKNNLKSIFLENAYSWLDTGTYDSLLEASNFVQKVEKNSNKKVGDLDNFLTNL